MWRVLGEGVGSWFTVFSSREGMGSCFVVLIVGSRGLREDVEGSCSWVAILTVLEGVFRDELVKGGMNRWCFQGH